MMDPGLRRDDELDPGLRRDDGYVRADSMQCFVPFVNKLGIRRSRSNLVLMRDFGAVRRTRPRTATL